ncbi:uncharacterized protein PHALS_13143 [Plasmopara halstedii]|uniref:Uncharacterized protein n=1 Tax=Plasmopara halstedii TaxID=4781 RepID=A0A0N7L602_PLAHL|nr:uncharacterized protein PHALS_13143 [Plasmopara halstedii]CEG42907.1 hypothetical protein PHALS_13143 [Plasmopara halstedii]|eukprot:XP_024579276.1 hypothetical protein PHALS_13143 [Plasmopara halstedii]
MDSTQPSINAASPPNVDTSPTIAGLLRQQDTIGRDNAEVKAARRRVKTPKLRSSSLATSKRSSASTLLTVTGRSSRRMGQALLYEFSSAKYDMVIDTSRTITKDPLQMITASLVGKNRVNKTTKQLYDESTIGQVSKHPGGNQRMNVKAKKPV